MPLDFKILIKNQATLTVASVLQDGNKTNLLTDRRPSSTGFQRFFVLRPMSTGTWLMRAVSIARQPTVMAEVSERT
jgi:hypothetical protein